MNGKSSIGNTTKKQKQRGDGEEMKFLTYYFLQYNVYIHHEEDADIH